MEKSKLGWNESFEEKYMLYKDKDFLVARVICSERYKYKLLCNGEILNAEVSGRYRYKSQRHRDYPSVGDWVVVAKFIGETSGVIHGLLERENAFTRKMPVSGGRKIRDGRIIGGTPEEQVLAANVDTVFIVMSVDGNFNISRIERYLTLAYNCGVTPVIILNKVDVTDNIEKYISEVREVAFDVPVHAVSATSDINMDCFNTYMLSGKTVVFFGSSGVGKSTITNYLLGTEGQKTSMISTSNGKGRHTTSTSQMLFHKTGCMIIDTPGLRELQLWCDESAVDKNFRDVVELIEKCKYRDCKHDTEIGCAIKKALESGDLSRNRYESYLDQYGEVNYNSKAKRMAEVQYNKFYTRLDKK
ncbi:MAG: ribosome small subunit-dependent GTPase A [Clostridiales bacterium]|nr:ribosome small subunit-dependent GTPase A [Clostridiales bacterium]